LDKESKFKNSFDEFIKYISDNKKRGAFINFTDSYLKEIKKLFELEYIKERLENENDYYNKIEKIFLNPQKKSIPGISIFYGKNRFEHIRENLYKKKRLPGDTPRGAIEFITKESTEIEEYNHYVLDKYNNYVKRYQFRAISFLERMILSENPDGNFYIEPADYGKEFSDLEGITDISKFEYGLANRKEKKNRLDINNMRTIKLCNNLNSNELPRLLCEELGEFSLNRIGYKRLIAVSPAFNKYIIRSNDFAPFINDGSIFDKIRYFNCIDGIEIKPYVSQGGGIIKIDLLKISTVHIRSQYTEVSCNNMNKLAKVINSVDMGKKGHPSLIADEIFLAKKSAYRNREIHLSRIPINSIIGWKPYPQFPVWIARRDISSPLIMPKTAIEPYVYKKYSISLNNKISNTINSDIPINSSKLIIDLLREDEYHEHNILYECIKYILHGLDDIEKIYESIKNGLFLSLKNIEKSLLIYETSDIIELCKLLKECIKILFLSNYDAKEDLHVSLDVENKSSPKKLKKKKNKMVSPEEILPLIPSYNNQLHDLEILVDKFNITIAKWILKLHFSIENTDNLENSLTKKNSITTLLDPELTVNFNFDISTKQQFKSDNTSNRLMDKNETDKIEEENNSLVKLDSIDTAPHVVMKKTNPSHLQIGINNSVEKKMKISLSYPQTIKELPAGSVTRELPLSRILSTSDSPIFNNGKEKLISELKNIFPDTTWMANINGSIFLCSLPTKEEADKIKKHLIENKYPEKDIEINHNLVVKLHNLNGNKLSQIQPLKTDRLLGLFIKK